jgi:hypothetical protein
MISSFLQHDPNLVSMVTSKNMYPVQVLATNQWSVRPYVETFAGGRVLQARELCVHVWYVDDPQYGRLRCLIARLERLEYSVDGGVTFAPYACPDRRALLRLLRQDDNNRYYNTLAYIDALVDDQAISIPRALENPKPPYMWPLWEALDFENEEDEKV